MVGRVTGHALLAGVAVGVLLALVRDVHAPPAVPPGVDARLVLLAVLALLALRSLTHADQALGAVHARLRLLLVTVVRALTHL